MKLVCISDTHGSHDELVIPNGDVLIHCGDYSPTGDFKDMCRFNEWLGTLPHAHKLVVSGNHDWYAEKAGNYVVKKLFSNATYLENEEIEIGGYKFWGSPITPEFMNWSFMRKRGNEIAGVWEQIPDNIDVLITHGPPYKILDETPRHEHVGCWDLLYHSKRVKPKIHVFGHIHHGYGSKTIWWHNGEARDCRQDEADKCTVFINCASLDEMYAVANQPIVVDI